jgi:hypothetical protein
MLLNFDATAGELAYRKLERSIQYESRTIFITKRSVFLNGAYPLPKTLKYMLLEVQVIELVKQQVL